MQCTFKNALASADVVKFGSTELCQEECKLSSDGMKAASNFPVGLCNTLSFCTCPYSLGCLLSLLLLMLLLMMCLPIVARMSLPITSEHSVGECALQTKGPPVGLLASQSVCHAACE